MPAKSTSYIITCRISLLSTWLLASLIELFHGVNVHMSRRSHFTLSFFQDQVTSLTNIGLASLHISMYVYAVMLSDVHFISVYVLPKALL